ncbi:MAG: carbohydrate ABC transporter permease [Chloroflexi bacterium]|nr:carbohydrate ABC transporter permease [Chloroflexota bacterium]
MVSSIQTSAMHQVMVGHPRPLRRLRAALVVHCILLICGLLIAFPFIWMILTSFKTQFEALAYPPTLLPEQWRWQNYVDAWQLPGSWPKGFPRYFVNTVFIAGITCSGALLTSLVAGYTFAKMEFFGKNVIFIGLLATLMVPFEATLVPDFIIIKTFHWYNTYTAQIIPWIGSVFGIFLMRQFISTLPNELWEAAQIDGLGHAGYLRWIVTPLSLPGLLTLGLFTFLDSWNALIWPLIVTSSDEMRPIQVGLAYFITEEGTQVNQLMAAATFTIIPVLVLFLITQRQFIEGIAQSGLKG